MQLTLREKITQFALMLQTGLFPALEQQGHVLTEEHKRFTSILSLLPLRRFVPMGGGWNGRPQKDRYCIACAFVAKAVLNLSTTRQLIGRLSADPTLLQLCGWEHARQLPHESTFSRTFAEFAQMELAQFVHEALVRDTQSGRLIGHIARDSTAIHARERVPETPSQKRAREAGQKPKRVRVSTKGRKLRKLSRKARLAQKAVPGKTDRQKGMQLEQILTEIPRECNIGAKTNSQGNTEYWRGYKLHLDVADGQIPITAVLTSANVHDSQLAIPMSKMSTARVTYCYELMDSAYDASAIHEHSRELGHVPIIDPKSPGGPKSQLPARQKVARQFTPAEEVRYRERTMVERVYGRLKDEFGARSVRVRGPQKVMAHLMFGVLALTADQLLRLHG